MIQYLVHPPALTSQLADHLRGLGYDVLNSGPRLSASYPTAADPTEERLMLGGAIAAWRREHPDARVTPADYEGPADGSSRST